MKRILQLFSAWMLVILTGAFSALHAQDRNVTGRVTLEEDGSPVPGVNVVVKGTTSGVTTGTA